MLALALSFLLLIYFSMVGFSALGFTQLRQRLMIKLLLAPAVGIGLVMVPINLLHFFNLPISTICWPVFMATIFIAILLLLRQKPIIHTHHVIRVGLIALAALLVVGWPMLLFGLDWLSYTNDDMANYVLGAQRYLLHGLQDRPPATAFSEHTDYTAFFWFMHWFGGHRVGSEQMIAYFWGLTGLNGHQLFVPMMNCFHMALVMAAGGLVSANFSGSRQAYVTLILMALSPLTGLGTLFQLIAQLMGLPVLCALLALSHRLARPTSSHLVGHILITALLFGGLCIIYPETLPFYVLSVIVFLLAMTWRRGRTQNTLRLLIIGSIIALGSLLLLNVTLANIVHFMITQAQSGSSAHVVRGLILPYFMLPTGLPTFWGILPLTAHLPLPDILKDVVMNGMILVAIALFGILLWQLFKQIKKQTVCAITSLVMLLLGGYLFYQVSDFGLFKLSMFIQPFVLGVMAIWLCEKKKLFSPRRQKIVLLLLLVPTLVTYGGYTLRSTGTISGSANDVPLASLKKVNQQFAQTMEEAKEKGLNLLWSDASCTVLAKFQSLYALGESFLLPSRDFLGKLLDQATGKPSPLMSEEDIRAGHELDQIHIHQRRVHLMDNHSVVNRFKVVNNLGDELSRRALITTNQSQSFYNAYYANHDDAPYFRIDTKPRNHLVFVFSDFGNHYYLHDVKKISYFELERDPMFPGRQFASMGQYLVFFMVGAPQQPRVLMELTSTILKHKGSQLPQPVISGTEETVMPFVGRGSGRMVSAPVQGKMIEGAPFLAFDMQSPPERMPIHRTGLMNLYHPEIPLDLRNISVFGRDVSIIDDEDYGAWQRPSWLEKFPADLSHKHLEYSGIYEDGWLSEHSLFVLSRPDKNSVLHIQGLIPLVKNSQFSTTLTVKINGKNMLEQQLALGEFHFRIPSDQLPESTSYRIELIFSAAQKLPGDDARVAVGQLHAIGFRP